MEGNQVLKQENWIWGNNEDSDEWRKTTRCLRILSKSDKGELPLDEDVTALIKVYPELNSTIDDILWALYSAKASKTILLDSIFFSLWPTGISTYWKEKLELHSRMGFPGFRVHGITTGQALKHWGTHLFAEYTVIENLLTKTRDLNQLENLIDHRQLIEKQAELIRHEAFISTYYFMTRTKPNIAVLYDFIPERLGWDLSAPIWQFKKDYISNATNIIGISETTLSDVDRFYPGNKTRKSYLSYCSFNSLNNGKTAVSELIGRRFVLCVGMNALYEHKRLALGIKVSEKLNKDGIIDYLVITGPSAAGNKELAIQMGIVNSNKWIIGAMFSQEELNWLYANALCNIQTSEFEGFGYSPLEAMSHKCLSFFENNEINREIYEGYGFSVSWNRVDDVAEKIKGYLEKKGSLYFKQLEDRLPRILRRYSPFAQYLSWLGPITATIRNSRG